MQLKCVVFFDLPLYVNSGWELLSAGSPTVGSQGTAADCPQLLEATI